MILSTFVNKTFFQSIAVCRQTTSQLDATFTMPTFLSQVTFMYKGETPSC